MGHGRRVWVGQGGPLIGEGEPDVCLRGRGGRVGGAAVRLGVGAVTQGDTSHIANQRG